MSGELDKLKEHREEILLAQVAALLHDMGKLSNQFLDQMSEKPSTAAKEFEHERAIEKIPGFVDNALIAALKSTTLRERLRWDHIKKQEQIGQLLDLILYHDRANHSAFLVRLLNRCDGADSGADKGTTRHEGLPKEAKQPLDHTFVGTAFGNEHQRLEGAQLDRSRIALSAQVGRFLKEFDIGGVHQEIYHWMQDVYRGALGETRRPANDVTLWDHSFSVATLYKTSLANFLMSEPDDFDISQLRWRLLRINFDVLGLYAKAIKIADLLGYQDVIDKACAEVKRLVEEEYPLGNEVYRDTTGIYFTFPDIDLPADLTREIRRRVEAVEMELAPYIAVEPPQGSTDTEQLKRMLAHGRAEALKDLAHPFTSETLNPYWQNLWNDLPDGKGELCPVCNLCPRAESAEVCKVCEQRRKSRIEWWKANPSQTIWIDEIADHNGRVALIVGKFGLEDWLSGDLVQTMLVRAEPNNPSGCTPKNPSPARLRRVWETCQRFWRETVEKEILAKHQYAMHTKATELRRLRLLVTPDKRDRWRPNVPYDGTLDGRTISLLWDANANHFITISNLQWAAKESTDAIRLAAEWQDKRVVVSDPDTPRRQLSFTVHKAEPGTSTYMPYLVLLSSPDQFLALAPATDALELAKKIRDEYTKQFGKVQNRLPLFLGLVFFPRKMPLTAVMDAARRMLEQMEFKEETWQIETVNDGKVKFANGVEWHVPTKMGDDTTDDSWYPYFFVADGVDVSDRPQRFQLKKEDDQDAQKVGAVSEKYANRWLVNVKDLREGDRICVTPSQFDFEWLDTNARRFEVAYANGKRRTLSKRNRPYLLEDLERFQTLWDKLAVQDGLSTVQIKQLDGLIEAKREEWEQPTGQGNYCEVFKRFVCDALVNAGWKKKLKDRDSKDRERLYQAALTGELHDVLHLYMDILKRKPEQEQQPDSNGDVHDQR
jgi:hypothetical protein